MWTQLGVITTIATISATTVTRWIYRGEPFTSDSFLAARSSKPSPVGPNSIRNDFFRVLVEVLSYFGTTVTLSNSSDDCSLSSSCPVSRAAKVGRFWNGRAVTPQATREYAEAIGWAAREAGARPRGGACRVSITAGFAIPTSWPLKKKRAACEGRLAHMTTPDVDNILKIVLDGLNGVAYADDSQVVEAACRKHYDGEKEGLEVRVEYNDT